MTRRGSRGSTRWIAVGVAASLFACTDASGCRKKTEAVAPDDARLPAKPLTFTFFREIAEAKEPIGVFPLSKAEAEKGWHWRLGARDGVLLQAEHIAPGGHVERLRSYARKDDGRLIATTLDEHGEMDGVLVLANDGTLTNTARSSVVGDEGCHHRKVGFDAQGRFARVACLDDAGHATPDARGCEVTLRTYDGDGQLARIECIDASGAPALFSAGDHARTFRYDAQGRPVMRESLDLDSNAMTDLDGCGGVQTMYDAASNRLLESCLDVPGDDVRDERFTYDANGCALRAEKHGRDEGLENREGFAIHVWHRNALCDATYEEKRDAEGKLIANVPVFTYVLDAHGWVQSETCEDALGKPISCQFGDVPAGAKVTYLRDELGRMTRRRAFTADGAPSRASLFYPHEFRFTYGGDGRLSDVAYFGEDGTPKTGNGIYRISFVYDSVGTEISRKFFDAAGSPMATVVGCHEFRTLYGDHHLFAARECRDVAGALHAHIGCLDSICWIGAARIKVVRTPGETINVFEDVAGVELRRISCDKEKCYR